MTRRGFFFVVAAVVAALTFTTATLVKSVPVKRGPMRHGLGHG